MSTECFVMVVPQDASPFTVRRQQLVRLTGGGIAGAKIVADVDGPAELVAENSILTVKNGHGLVGEEEVEFVIRPTGEGKVKVNITTSFLKSEPTVTTFEFEVK